jgi:hypothetical protein
VSVPLPGLEGGNGFDDLRYSYTLHKMMVPGNWTGNIYLIDPDTLEVTTIGGFSSEASWNNSDTQGPATLDEGGGFIFVGDRTSHEIAVVDPSQNMITSTVPADYPDYLRYVETTREVWVSEPFIGQVEVFSVSSDNPPVLTSLTRIGVGTVPEGLGVDRTRGLVFTQGLLDGKLVVMDAQTHQVTGTWSTGCTQTHGNAAVDTERGFVFAGCLGDATVSVLAIEQGGTTVGSYSVGPGAFLPSYSPDLRHLYLRGDPGTPIATLAVNHDGTLDVLETVDSVNKAHCLTADDRKHYWTCDWQGGAVIRLDDANAVTPP